MASSGNEAAASRNSRTRGIRYRLIALAASLFVGLLTAELICRWADPPRPPIRFRQDVDELNNYGLNRFADILEPDPELFWRLPPGESLPESAGINFGVISNSQRLRENHEIPYAKPPGTFRALFLGDSCTFGAGVHVDHCYVELAESELRREFQGTPVECINAGVPGYSLFQGWRYWETEGHLFSPDLVVACFGFNDMSHWDGLSDLEHDAAIRDGRPPPYLGWSRLCQIVWEIVHGAVPRAQPHPRLSPDEFRDLLSRLEQSTRAKGARLMLISWAIRMQVEPGTPGGHTLHQLVLQEFSRSHEGVELVDLVPVFEDLCGKRAVSEIYLDNIHTTALANAEVARHVTDAIAKLRRSAGAE